MQFNNDIGLFLVYPRACLLIFMSFFFTGNAMSYGFIVYQNDKLFQSKTFKLKFNQKIVSSTTKSSMHKGDQNVSVDMAFRPQVSFPTNRS